MSMVKAIFLDIDGVICCNQFGRLEDRKLQLLRQVVQQTGAKIVLSTDWRRVPKLKSQLIATLRDYGMEVIGSTPCGAAWQPMAEIETGSPSDNAAVMGNGDPITSFVAVDDRSLLQESGGDGLRGASTPDRPARAHLAPPTQTWQQVPPPPRTLLAHFALSCPMRTAVSPRASPQAASCTRATSPDSRRSARSAWLRCSSPEAMATRPPFTVCPWISSSREWAAAWAAAAASLARAWWWAHPS